MIDYASIRAAIAEGLKSYVGCEVVMANQAATMPEYPYISFTVTTAMDANYGTHERHVYYDESAEDYGAVYVKQVGQVWSFTAQSDDSDEAAALAYKAHDWFDLVGREDLSDIGVAVVRVQSITNRDSLLSIEYEYRCGFDVSLAIDNVIEIDEGTIEGVKLNYLEE